MTWLQNNSSCAEIKLIVEQVAVGVGIHHDCSPRAVLVDQVLETSTGKFDWAVLGEFV